jgi:hypothetical protein
MKELQTELTLYMDLRGIIFDSTTLAMLKRFEVEAFPYEYN